MRYRCGWMAVAVGLAACGGGALPSDGGATHIADTDAGAPLPDAGARLADAGESLPDGGAPFPDGGASGSACDDGIACTEDVRDPISGFCFHRARPGRCDDGDPCTADRCVAAVGCTSEAVPEGTGCGPASTCAAPVCRGGACVVEAPATGTPCDDGDLCTSGDACQGHVCKGSTRRCNAYSRCTEGRCDPESGQCVYDPIEDGRACGLASACAAWVCRDGECVSELFEDGLACEDHNACTQGEVCLSGRCVGDARCEDGSPCTEDRCAPEEGCLHLALPEGARCGASDLCSDAPVCQGGLCVTLDRLPDGTACDDGSLCTQGDACREGTCRGEYPGEPRTVLEWKPTWRGSLGLAMVGPERILAADTGWMRVIGVSGGLPSPLHEASDAAPGFAAAASLGADRYLTVRVTDPARLALRIVDLDARGLREVGALEVPMDRAYADPRLAVFAGTAYVAYGPFVHVVDLVDPARPRPVRRLPYSSGVGLALNPPRDELLVLDATGRLLVYGLADRLSPTLVREIDALECAPATAVPQVFASTRYVLLRCIGERTHKGLAASLDARSYALVREIPYSGPLRGFVDEAHYAWVGYVNDRPGPCSERSTPYLNLAHAAHDLWPFSWRLEHYHAEAGHTAAGHGLLLHSNVSTPIGVDALGQVKDIDALGFGRPGRVVEREGRLLSFRPGRVMGLEERPEGGLAFVPTDAALGRCARAVRGADPPEIELFAYAADLIDGTCMANVPRLCWADLATSSCVCTLLEVPRPIASALPFGPYLLTAGRQVDESWLALYAVADLDGPPLATVVPPGTSTAAPMLRGGAPDGSHAVAHHAGALLDLDTRDPSRIQVHLRPQPEGTLALAISAGRWARLVLVDGSTELWIEARDDSAWPPRYSVLQQVPLPRAYRILAFDGEVAVLAGAAGGHALWVVDGRITPASVSEIAVPSWAEFGVQGRTGFVFSGHDGVGLLSGVCGALP